MIITKGFSSSTFQYISGCAQSASRRSNTFLTRIAAILLLTVLPIQNTLAEADPHAGDPTVLWVGTDCPVATLRTDGATACMDSCNCFVARNPTITVTLNDGTTKNMAFLGCRSPEYSSFLEGRTWSFSGGYDCSAQYEAWDGNPINGRYGAYGLAVSSQFYAVYKPKYNNNEQLGEPSFCPLLTKNPINPAIGNKYLKQTLISKTQPNSLELALHYNSLSNENNLLGMNWNHNYGRKITFISDPTLPKPPLVDEQNIASNLYSTPDEACASGWSDIKSHLNKPWINDPTIAVNYSGQSLCEVRYDNNKKHGLFLTLYRTAIKKPGTPYYPLEMNPQILVLYRPDGSQIKFHKIYNEWVNVSGHTTKVIEYKDPNTNLLSYRYTNEQDIVEYYDINGVLTKLTDSNNNTQTISYKNSYNKIETISNNSGEVLTFTYNTTGNLETITDQVGRQWQFGYDSANNLQTVTNPDLSVRTYHYEDPNYPNAVTGISDERNIRYSQYGYDTEGKANMSTLIDKGVANIERIDIVYNADGTRTLTSSRGVVSTYTTTEQLGSTIITDITGPGCSACGAGDSHFEFDPNTNNLLSKTVKGVTTQYGNYDLNGNPGFITEAYGTSEERTTSYTYHPSFFGRVKTITEPSVVSGLNKVTTYGYDAFGNRTTITITGFAPNGAGGGIPVTRTIGLQYNGPLKQLSQIDGPRPNSLVNDIVTLDYYPNDPLQGNNRARLRQLISPANLILRDNIQYTPTGKVLSEQRLNGLNLAYTYYPGNDRLETLTETAGAKTRTTYWTYLATGEVKTVTQAYGTSLATTLTLGYDDARRLISITDNLGNKMQYTLDSEGNLENQAIHDKNNVLHTTISQTFDLYNQLDTRTLVDELTDFNVKADGTLDYQIDNKLTKTQYSYDNLKRLTTVTDDVGGNDVNTQDTLTQYFYDVADNLTQVVSPNNSTTTYVYDDLGNLLKEVSPDRGTVIYTQDEAGNIVTLTDGRNIQTIYIYDGLNRVTSIDYPGTTEDVSLQYDTAPNCTNGVGKLCVISDQSGTTQYSYDELGNTSSEIYTTGGVAYFTDYQYNLLDQIIQTTTPTGRDVYYGVNSIGQIDHVDATINGALQTILHNTQYRADGLLSQQEFGNGFLENRLYDLKGRLTSLSMPALATPLAILDANKDNFSTYINTPVNLDVLTNDTFSSFQSITLALSIMPVNGSAILNTDGTIKYQPNTGYYGTDSFTYSITEGTTTKTAVVQLAVIDSVDTDGDGIPDVVDLDDDNDGMPDLWELKYGLNPIDPNDAALDADSDGITNLQEFNQQTDPTVVNTDTLLNIVWTDLIGVSIVANTITDSGLSGWGHSGAASAQAIVGDGFIEFTAKTINTSRILGLSTTNASASYSTIGYGILLHSTSVVQVYESNVLKGNFGAYVIGDIFKVERIGSEITYAKNGVVFYTSLAPTSGNVIADAALYATGAEIADAKILVQSNEHVAPVISNITASVVGANQFVNWTTNEYSTSQVKYGINAVSEFTTKLDANLMQQHSVELLNLQPNTTYQYQVLSLDNFGNQAMGPINTFTTGNSIAATIQWTDLVGVSVSLVDNTLTDLVSTGWGNSGAASTQIIQGDGGVEFTAKTNNTARMLGLSNTNISAAYTTIDYAVFLHYTKVIQIYESGVLKGSFGVYAAGDIFKVERIGSEITYAKNGVVFYTSLTPSAGNLIADASLYTTGAEIADAKVFFTINEHVAPIISNITASVVGANQFVNWTTNEYSTSQVKYGINAVSEFTTKLDANLMQQHRVELLDLQPNTTYQYQVMSKDNFGNQTLSAINTFTTGNVVALSMAWTDLVGVSVNGNTITDTAATGWGNSGAASTQIIKGDGGVEFTANSTNTSRMLGLSATNISASYTTIDYAIYTENSGLLKVYESGVYKGSFGSYASGDVFRVIRLGSEITYTKNGVVFYTSLMPSAGDLIADAALSTNGAEISDVKIFIQSNDFIGPVISSVVTSVIGANFYVNWTTNEYATSQVNYGVNAVTEFSTNLGGDLAQQHSVELLDLQPNTMYQYQVLSKDNFGNQTLSAINTFTTGNVVALSMAWTDLVGVSVNGNTITDTAATGWGNSGAASTQIIKGDGGVEFTANSTNTSRMLGLSSTNSSAHFTTIGNAIYLVNNATIQIYESGVYKGSFGSYASGDVFRVIRLGSEITYTKNGVVFYTSLMPSAGDLIADAALHTSGGEIADAKVFFTINDHVAPIISNITASVVGANQFVNWTTNEYSTSQVKYGINAVSEFTTNLDANLMQQHSVELLNLQPNTTYQYQVLSQDNFGNQAMGPINTFTTGNSIAATIQWTDLVGVSVSLVDNTLTDLVSTGWGNSGAASTQIIQGDGGVEFTAKTNNTARMLGLSKTNISAAYTTIDYAVFLHYTKVIQIYESGVLKGSFGTYAAGDIFKVERIGSEITYAKNGVVFYTSLTPSAGNLIVDAALYTTGAEIAEAKIFGSSLLTASVPNSTNSIISRNSQSTLAVVSNTSATQVNRQYSVWRTGPETLNNWVQTAEDPNAYDKSATVLYISEQSIKQWRENDYESVPKNTAQLIAKMSKVNTIQTEVAHFIKVNHGTTTSPVAINTETHNYFYDGVGNANYIQTDNGNLIYDYDNLSRLKIDDVPAAPYREYGYDSNGNRTTETIDSVLSSYSYLFNTNIMDSTPASPIGRDGAGNTTSDQNGNRTFEYNNAGRLYRVFEAGVLKATYIYNAQGQRKQKITTQGTTIYHYDLSGNLISETTAAGAPKVDYVYNGSIPVAQINTDGGLDKLLYIHTDHLGTPRRATNPAGTVVWDWQSDAFGATQPNQDIDGDGQSTIINLRFAGQYYDQETGLHYNYFRYYDPSTGRSITSDPIGLAGGLNTYGYVGGNPTNYYDPYGLYTAAIPLNPATTSNPFGWVVLAGSGGVYIGTSIYNNFDEQILDAIGWVLNENADNDGETERERGLAPDGLLPPVENPDDCEVGNASRPSEKEKGGKSYWDPDGGEWRYSPEDKWHNPHWDYNPWDHSSSPWQNIPIGSKPPRK